MNYIKNPATKYLHLYKINNPIYTRLPTSATIFFIVKTVLYFQSNLKASAQKKLAGIRDIASKLHWNVQVIENTPTRGSLRKLIRFWEPVGAIVECGSRSATELPQDVFEGLPVVFLDVPPRKLKRTNFCITQDSTLTGHEAARILLEDGFTNFAYIAPVTPFPWSDERRDGFRAALKLNGHDCAVLESESGPADVLAFHQRVSRFLSGLPRPTAIFAANDTTAEIVLSEITRMGLRVTEDFAVIGVDNYEPVCERLSLSSVEPDFRRAGNLSLLMLVAVIRDGKSFRGARVRKYGPLRVIRRATTRASSTLSDIGVASALDLISREACKGLTAEKVLASIPCSRTLAAIRFKRATGHTALEEIHRVQLERAKSMLLDPHQQITAISDFCGFSNPNSLKKLFKREYGLSMRAWRAKALPATRL